MTSLAERIISFFNDLDFTGSLPEGISVMNPFRDNPEVFSVVSQFYRKFYNDNKTRHLILGINPGRFGAGATGIPFTDTIRLKEKCGLSIEGLKTHETSSVFIYEMIDRYGGPDKFYCDFFISSISPLGFTSRSKTGREVNYNYYDSRELTQAVYNFMIDSLKRQMEFGFKRDACFCLGTGKNFSFLTKLNEEFDFFKEIIPLEHPRFIMQYRLKKKQDYIESYIQKLRSISF
jgi:hypothetical protein